MALINCPYCNKEISDKAKVCVGCGCQLMEEENAEKKTIVCPECGSVSDGQADVCLNCGHPLNSLAMEEDKKEKPKSVFRKKWFWSLPICFVLLMVIVFFIFNNIRNQNYYTEIRTATNEIMTVASEAENISNQICSVWKNAIFDKNNESTAKYTSTAKDFEEAISNLFADEEFIKKAKAIRNKQGEIDKYFGELKNPPEKFEDAYDEFKELYYAYSDYVDFALSCRGSFNTYTEAISQKSSALMESYREVKVELLGE